MSKIDSYSDILYGLSHEDIDEVYSSSLNVHKPDEGGCYLLNEACEASQLENVKFFISKGADLDMRDSVGGTPLINSIVSGNFEIVKLLISAGADLECRGFMEETPFQRACSHNSLKIIKYLVKSGCDIHATYKDYGVKYSALDNAKTIEVKTYLVSLNVGT